MPGTACCDESRTARCELLKFFFFLVVWMVIFAKGVFVSCSNHIVIFINFSFHWIPSAMPCLDHGSLLFILTFLLFLLFNRWFSPQTHHPLESSLPFCLPQSKGLGRRRGCQACRAGKNIQAAQRHHCHTSPHPGTDRGTLAQDGHCQARPAGRRQPLQLHLPQGAGSRQFRQGPDG